LKTKTIALIDDQLLFRQEIKSKLLTLGLEVLLLNLDGGQNLAREISKCSAVLINLGNGGPKAVQRVKSLRKDLPRDVSIIGYCGHAEKELIQSALEAGAAAVVPNSQIALNLKKVVGQFLPLE
jgi:DNA-binding NarL/FixJ family response regulator